jgi:hypothetical protein
MTRSLKIYQGEDQTPVTDLTEPSSNVHVKWEEVEAGHRAYQFESSSSSFPMRDQEGETGNPANLPGGLSHISLAAHNRLIWDESGTVLFRGRMGPKDYSRGVQKASRAREVTANAQDINFDLRGIIVDGWTRPAESDVARVQALVSDYLQGSPRVTTELTTDYISSSNTVTLPALRYDSTDPETILRDIATTANKLGFITVDNEVFYDGWDSATYVAGIRISDRPDEWSATDASCTPGLGSATEISTPNGDFELGNGTNWSGAQVAAGFGAEGTDYRSHDIGVGAGGWTYDGWTGLTFTAGVTYTVRFWVAGTGDQRCTFGLFTTDDAITDGVQYRSMLGDFTPSGTTWTLVCMEWTPTQNRTGVRFSHSRGGSSTLATDQLTLWQGELVNCGLPSGGSDVATFPPIWDVGPASTEDGMQLLSGLRLYYGPESSQYVYVSDPTTANQYSHYEESLITTDPLISTSAMATTLAHSLLARRKYEERTYNVSVGPLNEDQIGCIKPGQLIQIKARAITDADDQFVSRRIAQLRWTTPIPGMFFAHMQLDRPIKEVPHTVGNRSGREAVGQHALAGSNSHPEFVPRALLTTQGDLPYRGASDWTRLAIGSSNTYLKSIGTVPVWATIPSSVGGGVAVEEDGVEEGTGIDRFDFTGDISVSVSGTQATVSVTAGAGGASWTQVVNESGASFANWTANDGTWASTGTIIQQTAAPSATEREARYNTKIQFGWPTIVEAEIRAPSAGQGTGANIQVKLILGEDGASGTQGHAAVFEFGTTDQVQWERHGNALIRGINNTLNLDQWYKLRIIVSGPWISYILDGTHLGNSYASVVQPTADYLMLATYNAIADFRNIKVWTLSGGAPA